MMKPRELRHMRGDMKINNEKQTLQQRRESSLLPPSRFSNYNTASNKRQGHEWIIEGGR
jgi:hypothetical protein